MQRGDVQHRLSRRVNVVACAREAQGAERERLWSEAKERDSALAEYEKRVARRIAVVVLQRL